MLPGQKTLGRLARWEETLFDTADSNLEHMATCFFLTLQLQLQDVIWPIQLALDRFCRGTGESSMWENCQTVPVDKRHSVQSLHWLARPALNKCNLATKILGAATHRFLNCLNSTHGRAMTACVRKRSTGISFSQLELENGYTRPASRASLSSSLVQRQQNVHVENTNLEWRHHCEFVLTQT
jgi:hypothetical protein